MSKLNFSNIAEAYTIPSAVIKETANEITRLKKIVEDSALNKNPQQPSDGYQRIGSPDKIEATFCNSNQPQQSPVSGVPLKHQIPPEDFEYTFLKLSRSPQFDDIIKNYILYKHPDWLLNSTSYSPFKESFGRSVNLPTDIKHYVIFFIVSIVIYLFLSLLLKRKQ
jgi:hypothetical protein